MNDVLKIVALLIVMMIQTGYAGTATVVVTAGNNGNVFSPSNFSINPGDTVKWVWVSGHHNTSAVTVPAGAVAWYANIAVTDTVFRYVPQISGLYTYTCTHHSGMDGRFFVNGCDFPVKPVVSSAGSIACTGDSLLLTTAAQAGCTYQWIKDGVTLTGATTNTCYATTSGTYKVLVNRCGMDSISAPYPVTVHALPVVSFTWTANGNAFTFTNTSPATSGHDFLWRFSDGSLPQTGINASHTFLSQGSHWVMLRATNTITGCTDSVTNPLEVSLHTGDINTSVYSVFPNPAKNNVTITISGAGNRKPLLCIYDAAGNCILKTSLPATSARIPLTGLKPGFYFYKLFDGNNKPVTGRLSVI